MATHGCGSIPRRYCQGITEGFFWSSSQHRVSCGRWPGWVGIGGPSAGSSDHAYIGGEVTTLSSKVAGFIERVAVEQDRSSGLLAK